MEINAKALSFAGANYRDIFHHQKRMPGSGKGATEEADGISDTVLLHMVRRCSRRLAANYDGSERMLNNDA